ERARALFVPPAFQTQQRNDHLKARSRAGNRWSVSQPRRIALLRCGTLIEYDAAKSTIGNSGSIIAGFDAFAALTLTPGAQRIEQFQGLNVHHLIHPDVFTVLLC